MTTITPSNRSSLSTGRLRIAVTATAAVTLIGLYFFEPLLKKPHMSYHDCLISERYQLYYDKSASLQDTTVQYICESALADCTSSHILEAIKEKIAQAAETACRSLANNPSAPLYINNFQEVDVRKMVEKFLKQLYKELKPIIKNGAESSLIERRALACAAPEELHSNLMHLLPITAFLLAHNLYSQLKKDGEAGTALKLFNGIGGSFVLLFGLAISPNFYITPIAYPFLVGTGGAMLLESALSAPHPQAICRSIAKKARDWSIQADLITLGSTLIGMGAALNTTDHPLAGLLLLQAGTLVVVQQLLTPSNLAKVAGFVAQKALAIGTSVSNFAQKRFPRLRWQRN